MAIEWKMLVDALFALATASLFAFVALLNARATTPDDGARLARRGFVTWWFGLAAVTLVNGSRSALAGFGVDDLGLHVLIRGLSYAPLAVALWGLLTYLSYIYLGHHRLQRFLAGYHALLFALLVSIPLVTNPSSVSTDGWQPTVVMAQPLQGLALAAVAAAVLGPPLVAALLYMGLYRSASTPEQRRRILLVSVAFVAWFGFAFAANASALSARDWWPLAARGLGIIATSVLLVAYGPIPAPASRVAPAESG